MNLPFGSATIPCAIEATLPTRLALFSVAPWWILFSIPLWIADLYVLHVLVVTGIFIIAAMNEQYSVAGLSAALAGCAIWYALEPARSLRSQPRR